MYVHIYCRNFNTAVFSRKPHIKSFATLPILDSLYIYLTKEDKICSKSVIFKRIFTR